MKLLQTVLKLAAAAAFLNSVHLPAQTVQEAVDIFMKTPVCNGFQLSPDGSHLSMILHRDNTNSIATRDVETGEVRVINGRPGQSVDTYHWIDGDNLLIRTNLRNESYLGLYAATEDLKLSILLGNKHFDDTLGMYVAEEVLRVIDPLPTVPGMALLADATKDELFVEAVYYETSTNTLANRQMNDGKVLSWICDQDGGLRLVRKLGAPGETDVFYRANVDDEWEKIELGWDCEILGFNSTGNSLYISFENEDGNGCFQIFDLDTRKWIGKPVNHKEFSCSPSLLRDGSTGEIVGAKYDLDKPKIVYFDSTYREIHAEFSKLFPGSVLRILGKTKRNSILFEVRSDVRPMVVLEFDSNSERKFNLVVNQAPWIKREDCQPMTPIAFAARDNMTIHGYLTRSRKSPDQAGPTVMLIHEGPKVRDSWGYDSEVQLLAYLGYHVIQVNYRGSAGFNADYSIEEYPEICRKSVEDVADAARWAIAEGIADPDRIAIMGGSFGGYAALAGAAFEPDLYEVAIGFAGVYNFDRQLTKDYQDEPTLRDWVAPITGDIEGNPDLYANLSPANFADQIKANVLLIHGGADRSVSAKQSKQMRKALKKAGVPHEVEISIWGGQGLFNETERKKFGILIGEFLRKYL